jgi:hypothetical protein
VTSSEFTGVGTGCCECATTLSTSRATAMMRSGRGNLLAPDIDEDALQYSTTDSEAPPECALEADLGADDRDRVPARTSGPEPSGETAIARGPF